MAKIYNSIVELIGKTPILKANNFAKVQGAGAEILTKLDHIKQFLEKDYVQNTIKRVFKMLKIFVISMRPRKGEGYIDIGLKSAYDTGNLMAMIAPYYPIYGSWLAVNPYFNEQKIEGKLSIKGRVFVCVIAFPAIGLVLTKDFRKTVALARKI